MRAKLWCEMQHIDIYLPRNRSTNNRIDRQQEINKPTLLIIKKQTTE